MAAAYSEQSPLLIMCSQTKHEAKWFLLLNDIKYLVFLDVFIVFR